MSIIIKSSPLVEDIAIVYVDSINPSSYMIVMASHITKYINENMNESKSPEYYQVDSDSDILKKSDGLWFVKNEKESCINLYKKTTLHGWIWNSIDVKLVFKLKSTRCSRIVPHIPKTKTKYESFIDELKDRVGSIKK
jgi:hypothetical protein